MQAVSGVDQQLVPGPLHQQDDKLDQDWLPVPATDAPGPLGCHPPCTSQPCAPEADPRQPPLEQAQGESVGHWIDSALADEGCMWAGSFENSDEPGDPLRVGSAAGAHHQAK